VPSASANGPRMVAPASEDHSDQHGA